MIIYINDFKYLCVYKTINIVKQSILYNILSCPENSRRKRFKFSKCILKFKSSFQFSFKIGTNFPDNPIYIIMT